MTELWVELRYAAFVQGVLDDAASHFGASPSAAQLLPSQPGLPARFA
jgi:hypothetical protein